MAYNVTQIQNACKTYLDVFGREGPDTYIVVDKKDSRLFIE
jgi:hypothetical protein